MDRRSKSLRSNSNNHSAYSTSSSHGNDSNGGNNGKRPRNSSSSLTLPIPSDGARITYADLLLYEPQKPPPETFKPIIHRGLRNREGLQVLPAVSSRSHHNSAVSAVNYNNNNNNTDTDSQIHEMEEEEEELPPPIFLVRETDPTQAYAKIPRPPISLDHHGSQWGCIFFAVVYEKVAPSVFQAPSGERQSHYVAIKQLRKSVLQDYKRHGGNEDPYIEIARMQELGDNIHVLSCVEALEDDEFLYIVTPKASAEGTLKDAVAWLKSETMDPERARELFVQLLRILSYLEQHGICHRDMSPDNFIFLSPHRLVAFDFALSHRVPLNEMGKRTLVQPLGNFGTRAYMAPEVYKDLVFDTVSSDLWAVVVILYNLMTNQPLYYLPHPTDICFRYFILARGLSSLPLNEKTYEIMQTTFKEENSKGLQHDLLSRAKANMNISPEAIKLFENVFRVDPSKRWNLAQVIECDYVCGEE
jgi:hypothetical protein